MGQLMTMGQTIVAGRGAMLNGSGEIASCRMKILPRSPMTTRRLSTWLPVSLRWETMDLGSALSLSIRENPGIAPSTDPIIQVQGLLSEYPLLLTIFETQSSLAFTNLTLTVAAISQDLTWLADLVGL